jgi:2-phospho-L-lactate guanylyltransferase
MKTLVAVPMKPLSAAKSRLSTGLDSAQRERVVLDLFIRGQKFLCKEFPELTRVVVTKCPFVTGAALRHRTVALPETDSFEVVSEATAQRGQAGLNRAAMVALNQARIAGFDWLLILPGDLPHLLVKEFRELLSMREPGRATVVASRDGGTNALLLPVTALSPNWSFDYGEASAERHVALLEKEGIVVTRLDLPALAQDVDTVDDYARLRSWWQDDDWNQFSHLDAPPKDAERNGLTLKMQSAMQWFPCARVRYA